jgi:acetyl-CoA acetyltransferase
VTNKVLNGKFAIVGQALIAGRFPDHSARSLQAEAARLAIEDAGLSTSQVDGAIDLRLAPGSGDIPSSADAFPRVLGMPCRLFFQISRGGTAGILGIVAAAKFLELGAANYIVLAYSARDWSRSRTARSEGITSFNMIEKSGYWGKPFGDLTALSHHSFFASRHMHEYGTRSEDFGNIAVSVRQWACLNPLAQFHDRPLTLDDYLNSPPLVDPYRLFDVCTLTDGAMAFVMTTAQRAADLPQQAVNVLGAGFGEAMEHLWWEKANYTRLAVDTAKATAFAEAEIEIGDVDFAGLYDCFTGEVLFQLEDYGWCSKGEAGDFVADGRIAPGGSMPINTSGGLLSAYHLGELTHLSEAIVQLRGEAGNRQVHGARVGLVSGHGGEILSPGMCSTHATLLLGAG